MPSHGIIFIHKLFHASSSSVHRNERPAKTENKQTIKRKKIYKDDVKSEEANVHTKELNFILKSS